MKNNSIALAVCIALSGPKIAAAETFTGIAAMNLGDINSRSYLDEFFSGSIPILYTSAKEALSFKARLAPDAVFDDLGVDRLPILKSLQFDVKLRNNKPYVAIKSSKAIDLPFLSFVVEVYSPEGSIYQDYTVLLDPRHFSAKNTSTNVKQSFNAESNATPNIVPSVKISVAAPSNTVKTSHPKRLRVKAGDTLSSIASSLKLDEMSNKNMSLAIFLKNPRAFSGNNVNKLKKGVTLKIPTFNEVNELIQRKPLLTNPLKQVKVSNSHESSVDAKVDSKSRKAINNQGVLTASYTVKRGDSLSAIARKYASKSVSFATMMTNIHSANPHAFTNNKANLLKKGAALSIPLNKTFKSSDDANTDKLVQEIFTTQPESLEVAINLSLASLEKRLREIRKALKSTKSELFDLKLTLKNKDILLQRKSKDIQILKKKLLNANQSTLAAKEGIALPVPAEKNTIGKVNSNNQASVSEMVTYSGLALLMGLVLLRVGRQKYAESIVASNDYIPTANIDPQLPIEKLNFKKTLTEGESEGEPENAHKTTNLSAQQSERLVEELVDELDLMTVSHNVNSSSYSDRVEEANPLDSWVLENTSHESYSKKETTALKADVINSLEKKMEERVRNDEEAVLTEHLQQQPADHTTVEIDLEKHLQSINDEIAINKMKDLV